MALMAATIFMAVVLVTIVAVSARQLQQRREADAHSDYNKAFDAMEGALAQAKAGLESSGAGNIGLNNWTPVYNSKKELVLPDFNSSAYTPVSLPGDPGVTGYDPPKVMAAAINWGKDGIDNNGDGAIDDANEKGIRSIHVAAKFRNATRRVEAVYAATDVNVWNNAIFAGVGASDGVIKGNVNIGGSVHILGDNLLAGGIAIEDAIDLTGNTLLQNNYNGVPSYLEARVPALATVNVVGKTVETLHAKLRVKHGLVGMSGNSRIGEPYSPSDGAKNYVDGTYVTDGWSGNKTTSDGGRGIPTSVYSDNGWSALYDLGDKVPFPQFTDPWHDPDTGAKAFRSNGIPYTYEEYFSEVLLADPQNPTDGIYTGNITINASGSAFYWNANTNTTLTGSAAVAAAPAATDDYLKFDPTAKTLKMNGDIRINGTLSFTGGTINYSGRCAILTTGNVSVDANLLSCNNGVPSNYANSFPVNNCLGIMSKANISLGTSSQLDMVGAFYAAGTISMAKQTNLMGTIVGSYFDIGNQVPNIYQVPSLAANLPLGMIGNYPVLSMTQVSWREMGLQ
jgi:phage baseplate assembly protein gpV